MVYTAGQSEISSQGGAGPRSVRGRLCEAIGAHRRRATQLSALGPTRSVRLEFHRTRRADGHCAVAAAGRARNLFLAVAVRVPMPRGTDA